MGLKGLKDFIESGKPTLKFVVSGKMGVGKSSLINGLLGKKVAREDLSPRSVTPDITEYKLQIEADDDAIQKKVDVAILDCPGLGDPLGDEEANLTAISEHCQDADLFIYCMDMRGRFTTADASGIKEFDQRVGSDIWKNTVFVLTFANEVLPSESERNEKFRVLLEQWEEILPSYFRDKMMLPEELASDISVIPAGYGSSSPPPDRKDWFSRFWFAAFRKIKEEAQPSLLGINLHRVKVCSSDHDTTKLMQQNLENHELPIFIVAPTPLSLALGIGGGALLGALI